tara:strand:- start:16 stop:573 length:558 start_codon:yes stop_codon:yes gene_type:complete
MTILKKQYYLYIENTNDIDLKKINKRYKFTIIYRNKKANEKLELIRKFRKKCQAKSIKFYLANDEKLAIKIKADGLYVSSFNKKKILRSFKEIIGASHNNKEINLKIWQGCEKIILSRLFKTNYLNKKTFWGIIKFNLIDNKRELIPLGGINLSNLNKLNSLDSRSAAFLSEVKKKPAKILRRLF